MRARSAWLACRRISFRAQWTLPGSCGRWAQGCDRRLSRQRLVGDAAGVTPELREAVELGVTLFAGEAEDHFGELLSAAYEDRLKPIYNFTSDLPDLGECLLPFMPLCYVRRYAGAMGCSNAPGAAVPLAVRFAPLSTCKGASRAFARRMTSSV